MSTQPQPAHGYEPSQTKDSEREQMILDHLPQVRWIATRAFEKVSGLVSLEDLMSTGVIGLINAVDSFDPSFGVKLKTYAEYKIRGAILDSLRGLDAISQDDRKKIKLIEAAITTLEHLLLRTPTEDEIAAKLGLAVEVYREWLTDAQRITIGSLDAQPAGEGSGSWLQYLADPDAESPAKLVERADLEKLLAEAVLQLPEQERVILDLYYRQECTLREIGTVFNLHLTRIAQLKSQAVLRLRSYMLRRWPGGRGEF